MCGKVKYNNGVTITYEVTLTISECAGRALDALVGYGDDAFIKHFKENLGESYLENHEKGLKEFFSTIRAEVIPQLRKVTELRKQANQPTSQYGP